MCNRKGRDAERVRLESRPGPLHCRQLAHATRRDTSPTRSSATAWGVKFVLVAARSADPHGRIILDVEWVPIPGGEARTAMDCIETPTGEQTISLYARDQARPAERPG
jgi:hypothetical protein